MEEFNLVELEMLIEMVFNYIARFPDADDIKERKDLLEKLEQMRECSLKCGIEF